MKAYKVVEERRIGGYSSICAKVDVDDLDAPGRIYEIGKKTEADERLLNRGYGLCVFATLRSAKSFATFDQHILVGEVPSIDLPPELKLDPQTIHSAERLLIRIPRRRQKRTPRNWPKGTRMTPWFLPEEVIK